LLLSWVIYLYKLFRSDFKYLRTKFEPAWAGNMDAMPKYPLIRLGGLYLLLFG